MNAKDWRLQFETLIEEFEGYLEAHAKPPHDVATCNGIGLGGNEWSCLRAQQDIELCRQVLARHPR